MTSEPQEIVSGKNLAERSLEVDFAVVLSRVIESIEDDPAQLRNAVYELARIKLRREAWQRDPPLKLWQNRHLTLALESAIERVETIYSKHDELRAPQPLNRLIESSEIGRSEVLIEPPEPLLIVSQAPARTADAEPVFLTRAKGASLKVERSSHWAGAAPMLRGALVAIFSVALCVVLKPIRPARKPSPADGRAHGPEKRESGTEASCPDAWTGSPVARNYAATILAIPAPDSLWRLCRQRRPAPRVGGPARQSARPKGFHVDADQDTEPHCASRWSNCVHRLSPRCREQRA